jgi:hypothetical protein
MSIAQRFAYLVRQGASAYSQGDWHASADAMLEAYKLPADQINYDDRVDSFDILAGTFVKLHVGTTIQELKALHEIVNCEKEPFMNRSLGALLYGSLNTARGDLDRAGDSYRQVMALVHAAPEDERLRCISTIRVQTILQDYLEKSQHCLQHLEQLVPRTTTSCPVKLRGVGGNECDCCRRTLAELESR